MEQPNNLNIPNSQRGAAVLLISIILLIGVTLIIIFTARIGITDQRIAANEYRHKEAQASADASLEQAAAFIDNNIGLYDGDSATYPWKDCTDVSIKDNFPCLIGTTAYELAYDGDTGTTAIDPLEFTTDLPSGTASDSYLVFTTSSTGNILTAIGTGASLDESGNAYAEVSYGESNFITPGRIPPVMASGVGLNGSFTIVADPRVELVEINSRSPGNPNGNPLSCTDVEPHNGDNKQPNPLSGPVYDEDGNLTYNADGTIKYATLGNISLWVNAAGSSGTWQTCSIGEYVDASTPSTIDGVNNGALCVYEYDDEDDWSNCACPSDTHLSDSDNGASGIGYEPTDEHPDIKGDWNVLEPFPASPFVHFFNGDDYISTYDSVLARAQSDDGIFIDRDCVASDFDDFDKLVIWITGDCSFDDVGTQIKPIVAVVEGQATINGNSNVFGVIVGLGDMRVNGGAIVHGALIMEDAIANTFQTLGSYTQVYDFCVMSNLQDNSINTSINKFKYSAKNFQL